MRQLLEATSERRCLRKKRNGRRPRGRASRHPRSRNPARIGVAPSARRGAAIAERPPVEADTSLGRDRLIDLPPVPSPSPVRRPAPVPAAAPDFAYRELPGPTLADQASPPAEWPRLKGACRDASAAGTGPEVLPVR